MKRCIHGKALFSRDYTYRYALARVWDESGPVVTFIGLNPSTADDRIDDPTVRRCVGFAQRWGYGQLLLGNLFAYRSTSPGVLGRVSDPVGPLNDRWLRRLVRMANCVVAAWGAGGRLSGRDEAVLAILGPAHCLGTTREGHPRHPLYLPSEATPRPFP